MSPKNILHSAKKPGYEFSTAVLRTIRRQQFRVRDDKGDIPLFTLILLNKFVCSLCKVPAI